MLKKSLIPAALIALSSASAFADAESFYFGVKGYHFMPAEAKAKGPLFTGKLSNPKQTVVPTGTIMLPGIQIGYHVTDSIRVGLAGYLGFGEYKSEFTAKNEYESRVKKAQDHEKKLKAEHADLIKDSAIRDTLVTELGKTSFTNYIIGHDSANDGSCLSSIGFSLTSLSINTTNTEVQKLVEIIDAAIKGTSVGPANRAAAVAQIKKEYTERRDGMKKQADDKAEAVKESGKIVKDLQTKKTEYETEKGADASKNDGQWVETLALKGALLATADLKVYENDMFSLSAGVGLGAANWKHSWKFESHETGADDDAALPEKSDSSDWKLAGMVSANANIALGDVATLTLSAAYANFGTPEFDYKIKSAADSKSYKASDETRCKGFLFGVGLGKDF